VLSGRHPTVRQPGLVTLVAVVVCAATVAAGAVAPPAPQATRSILIAASDGKGAPVLDLTAKDITIKEDGKAREVTKVERAAGPLTIALLIDDNGVGANDARLAIAGFLQRLRGVAEVSIGTTAGQHVTRVDYTTDFEAQIAAVRQLYARPPAPGGALLDAIVDASKSLQTRKAARPNIVAMAFGSEEFNNVRQDRVLDQLQQSGAILHVISMSKPNTTPGLDENLNRNKVLGDGPKQSGGRYEEMVASAGLTKALQLVADDLVNQYVVSYTLPAGVSPSGKIAVAIGRRGVTLRAPTRVPER
jgi:VWFA-related protein